MALSNEALKVGSVRYLLHIPASASEVTVDVSRISPESRRNFSCSRRPKLPLCTVADDDDACLKNSFGTADESNAVSRRSWRWWTARGQRCVAVVFAVLVLMLLPLLLVPIVVVTVIMMGVAAVNG
mmetsp:Transcript_30830/g.52043  ORF Transcript_30830/g.52043 Transcript_30830/m.52043 type:complete len:126 (+) Transcript_30830:329-706(+)